MAADKAKKSDRPEPLEANQSGVDCTLIDEMLKLSPEERLQLNDRMIQTILELRNGFREE